MWLDYLRIGNNGWSFDWLPAFDNWSKHQQEIRNMINKYEKERNISKDLAKPTWDLIKKVLAESQSISVLQNVKTNPELEWLVVLWAKAKWIYNWSVSDELSTEQLTNIIFHKDFQTLIPKTTEWSYKTKLNTWNDTGRDNVETQDWLQTIEVAWWVGTLWRIVGLWVMFSQWNTDVKIKFEKWVDNAIRKLGAEWKIKIDKDNTVIASAAFITETMNAMMFDAGRKFENVPVNQLGFSFGYEAKWFWNDVVTWKPTLRYMRGFGKDLGEVWTSTTQTDAGTTTKNYKWWVNAYNAFHWELWTEVDISKMFWLNDIKIKVGWSIRAEHHNVESMHWKWWMSKTGLWGWLNLNLSSSDDKYGLFAWVDKWMTWTKANVGGYVPVGDWASLRLMWEYQRNNTRYAWETGIIKWHQNAFSFMASLVIPLWGSNPSTVTDIDRHIWWLAWRYTNDPGTNSFTPNSPEWNYGTLMDPTKDKNNKWKPGEEDIALKDLKKDSKWKDIKDESDKKLNQDEKLVKKWNEVKDSKWTDLDKGWKKWPESEWEKWSLLPKAEWGKGSVDPKMDGEKWWKILFEWQKDWVYTKVIEYKDKTKVVEKVGEVKIWWKDWYMKETTTIKSDTSFTKKWEILFKYAGPDTYLDWKKLDWKK